MYVGDQRNKIEIIGKNEVEFVQNVVQLSLKENVEVASHLETCEHNYRPNHEALAFRFDGAAFVENFMLA